MVSWFLFLLSFGVLNSTLTVVYPQDISGTSFEATQVYTNCQKETLSGRIVFPTENSSLDGDIVLLGKDKYYDGAFTINALPGGRVDLVLGLQMRGAIGVVLLNTDLTGVLYNDLEGFDEINITVVESNCQWLYDNLNQDIIVNITFDSNQYYNFAIAEYPYIIFSITIGTGALVAIFLASYKLWKLGEIEWKLSVSTVCLGLEIMAGILRFLFAIDPSSHYNILPYNMSATLSSLHFPFYFASTLLISLYWFMLMRPTKIYMSKKILKKLSIPLFVVAGSLFIIEIIQNIIRATTGILMTLYVSTIYGLLDIVGIIFFFWNGFRIYIYLHKVKAVDIVGANLRLLKATRLILLSGFVSLLVFVTIGLLLVNYSNTPQGHYLSIFVLFFCMEAVSIIQILAFDISKKKEPGSESKYTKTEPKPQMDSCSE